MANQLSRAAYNQQRAMQRGLLGRGEIPDTSLLGRFTEDARIPGAASGFAKGLLSGAVGLPADVLSLMNMPLAASPYNAGAQKLQGLLQPFTSDGIAEKLGADPSRMTTQAGLIGAPDPGDIGKVAMRAGQDGLLGAMTLFHGTPHKFDNFDLKAIGTGEGAQAYGHGLYFAEDANVAKNYVPRDFDAEEVMLKQYQAAERAQDYEAMELWERAMMHEMPEDIRSTYKSPDYPDSMRAKADAVATELDGLMRQSQAGHLYEVDIPDDTIDLMLDYDAPVDAESSFGMEILEAVEDDPSLNIDEFRDALGARGTSYEGQPEDGASVYGLLSSALGGDDKASQWLSDIGIPGIRYFDGGSRGTGEGTRNIVVFNPEDIREVKRDGEVVLKR